MTNIFKLFLLVVSCIYLTMAFKFSMFSNGIPGSGFLPQVIGLILVLLTAVDLVKSFKDSSKENFDLRHFKELILLILFCSMYVFLFNIIGALLSTVLFTGIVLFIFNKGKLKQNIIISILVPGLIFLMFEVLLQTGLPKGIFEGIY